LKTSAPCLNTDPIGASSFPLPTTIPVGAESGKLEEYTVNNLSLAQVAQDCHFAEFQWNQDPDVVSMVAAGGPDTRYEPEA
jgi:hypothetical protein